MGAASGLSSLPGLSGSGAGASDANSIQSLRSAAARDPKAAIRETAKQFEMLRDIGVEAYQGWLLSRAVPPEEFRALLELGPLHVPS